MDEPSAVRSTDARLDDARLDDAGPDTVAPPRPEGVPAPHDSAPPGVPPWSPSPSVVSDGRPPTSLPPLRDALRLAADAARREHAHGHRTVTHQADGGGGLANGSGLPDARSTALTDLLSALRGRVWTYVGDRRLAGARIEHLLPQVKALVREGASGVGPLNWHVPLEELVVRWAIEAYYDPTGAGSTSRVGAVRDA